MEVRGSTLLFRRSSNLWCDRSERSRIRDRGRSPGGFVATAVGLRNLRDQRALSHSRETGLELSRIRRVLRMRYKISLLECKAFPDGLSGVYSRSD